MTFSDLGLSTKVLAAVEAAGYTQPTPIQLSAIPLVLQGRDLVGVAQTGTGKTAAFTLPMLTKLEGGRARARMPRTLILEPTRELAAQVEENFVKYGANHKITMALLIGGVSFDEQEKKLDRGVDVLIATPGRLLDHFERGKLLLNGVEILVIDEADRMLDMGFIPDIERILKLITRAHQTMLFSATMPPEIKRLADAFLKNPEQVEVARAATTAKTVTQRLVKTSSEAEDKRQVLRSLIQGAEDLKNAIVFCNRKRDVATLFRSLQKHGFNVGSLHGDMDQHSRMATLDSFRKGTLTLLVASDVAARGLDIPEVSHVFNFDVPTHAEDYVHRIGRTGRAGRSGTAITLVAPSDTKLITAIAKLTGETVEWMGSPPTAEEAEERPARRSREGEKSSERSTSARRGRGRGDDAGGEARSVESRGRRAPKAPAAVPASEPQPEAPAASPERQASAPEPQRRAPERDRPQREHTQREHTQRDQPRRRHDHSDDNEPSVVGLGDHVPAFLMRPVRIPRSPEVET
jgi:superfamily II DNA/RNA helicase